MRSFRHKLVWLFVISSILFNLGATRFELLTNLDLIDHPFYGFFLTPFNEVRYGHYIARKLFLVVIAFLVIGYWLVKQKQILQWIRSNTTYIIFIGLVLVVTRILTYGFWFYNDDTRFFHFHLFAPTQTDFNPQGMWGPVGLHPIAIFLLVMRWFGTNYTLYNTLSLFFFFLVGVSIFALASKLQNSKFVSLVTATFFLTTPTYFQGRLLIGEIINSPFILLLVILSIYMLLQKFIPGALIFAAAALEYGVAKSYFIVLPLTLFALLFIWPKKTMGLNLAKQKVGLILFVVSIWLISLVYKQAFYRAPSYGNLLLGSVSEIFKIDQLYVLGDVLMSLTLPYVLTYPLVHLLSLILNGWIYITAALGFLIVASFIIIGAASYFRGKRFSAKLIIIALSIILPTATIASFMGVRIDHNVQRLVQYSNNGNVPSGATGYGIFPALGLTLILVAFGYLTKRKIYKILVVVLILLNIVGSVAADYRWLHTPYAYPQRKFDEQLQKILFRDGINKYIYIPSQQRTFYQGVITFGSIYQGDQGIYVFMSPEDFVKALKENKAQPDHIYFFISNGKPKYDIYDYSKQIRSTPYDKLLPLIESLTSDLTPKDAEF